MLQNVPSKDPHTLSRMLDAQTEVERLNSATVAWHGAAVQPVASEDLLLQLHRANFDLWHLEDLARDPNAGDSTIADVKRRIDRTNQQRNDLVERIDAHLLTRLAVAGLPTPDAPLHSETPGMILDRLSILSLKLFHTEEEAGRRDADEVHRTRNHDRLHILRQQQGDLLACLAALWSEVCRGTRRFQLYRQMKMYNDPELNPVLYRAGARGSA